jgi:hypothetical protein
MPREDTYIQNKMVYSIVDAVAIKTTATAVITPSVPCGPKKKLSALDSERLEGVDATTVTFRSNCVGSIMGVTAIWN